MTLFTAQPKMGIAPTPSRITVPAIELPTTPPTEAATVLGSNDLTSENSGHWLIISRAPPVNTRELAGIQPAAAWVAVQPFTIPRACCSASARVFITTSRVQGSGFRVQDPEFRC